MSRPSDREWALRRQIKDLLEQKEKLLEEIRQLKMLLEKEKPPVPKKGGKKAPKVKECPSCGAEIKDTVLPFGRLEICSKGCGYRKVIKDV